MKKLCYKRKNISTSIRFKQFFIECLVKLNFEVDSWGNVKNCNINHFMMSFVNDKILIKTIVVLKTIKFICEIFPVKVKYFKLNFLKQNSTLLSSISYQKTFRSHFFYLLHQNHISDNFLTVVSQPFSRQILTYLTNR